MEDVLLDPPTYCDNCASTNIECIENEKLYGIRKGKWPYVWRCLNCNASVGCHPNTFRPLGKMASRAVRVLRKDAHIVFDQLWQSGLLTRSAAYLWLADKLNISVAECHISLLSMAQLKRTIAISQAHFDECRHIAERRKLKRQAKRKREIDYEKQRIKRRKHG